ncbi:hypothetical protein [Moorena producens]|nr:hypothetical protein [Moorena producens]
MRYTGFFSSALFRHNPLCSVTFSFYSHQKYRPELKLRANQES